jgi:hypothetical protein
LYRRIPLEFYGEIALSYEPVETHS